MYIETICKYVHLNSEQLTSTFSFMLNFLKIVSIFKHSRALNRSWKIIHGVLESAGKVLDFCL